MPRKIIVHMSDGAAPVLQEVKAQDEFQLQELVKDNPDLLPIEEFGMTGPLMVIGRETTLPSGAVDLVALARSGEILVIEFKTGPQNTDFRSALTQLIDYGSDMWTMSYEDFESTVVLRYFGSDRCNESRLRGLRSLEDGARAVWDGISDEEMGSLRDKVSKQLETGAFHYLLVAQRFTSTVERTAQYLNSVVAGPTIYAVELVRFEGDGVSAFESRTVLKPVRGPRYGASAVSYIDEGKFFEAVADEEYKSTLRELLETCRGLGLRFEWGSAGLSIRVPTPDRPEPLTVAWIFPPGRSGWMGLRDLNMGWERWSADQNPSVQRVLEEYLEPIRALPGAESAKAKNLQGTVYHLSPENASRNFAQIREILASLVKGVSAAG
ncbi:MAG: hypothetical protein HYS09_06570 [Chloroflexi bacterium]|nr:hypothetical protein [Chloroflexota bacterium]